MRHAAKSHIGLVRENNEDAYACAPELGLFVIADGLGGMARGEVASRMAADHICAGITARHDPAFDTAEVLRNAIIKAHEEVLADNKAAERFADEMGTTATALMLVDGTAYFAHAGDSRIYAVSPPGSITQVTTDQTMAQRMIDRGEEREYSIAYHGHILTNFIGIKTPFSPETGTRSVANGDTFLLCTDGLTDMVTESDIAAIAGSAMPDPERAADALIERALENGGRDNVTVIVVRPED